MWSAAVAVTLLAAGRLALEGLANKAIVRRLGADAHTLGKWPRCAEVGDENVTEVTARTLEETLPRRLDALSTIPRIRHTGSHTARQRPGYHLIPEAGAFASGGGFPDGP
ncbi:MAG: hypothetical protein OXC54_03645, partial [Rhodospirillaceae bacterium]|nr:hypothetical protein [Rhodospirillaceae bacterium]